MVPRFLLALLLGCLGGVECGSLGGCAKPKDLPDITVRAGNAGEMADFRAELGARFAPEQLQPFDTAVQELQLDAMNRGVASADAREQDMLAAVSGKTVHEALVLGWQARRERFLREIAELTKMLEHDQHLWDLASAATTRESAMRRIGSEKEVLAKLRDNLAAADQMLTDWGATPGTHPKAP